ncbi:hypothetical protein [Flavobacterium sp.]|uniref:hypothetical protein n=1 Tax=Flavobacterium sp. TaxID=239 RepID=UPI0025BE8392|nr:hypothetical protein [Flavobacterium sp.]MBA4155784.1 hypothetical protein [Flavobacterium sp.]
MNIPKLLLDELNVIIPVSENLGDSKATAIKISCPDGMLIVIIQNEIIDLILNEEPWKKIEQSLIFDEDKKYDMIAVIELLDDGTTKKHVFWFDITECFYIS